jgi:Glutamyl- and glutaminyl-tRNA synthetases
MAAGVAWSLARQTGGTFLLRHEDIDGTRVREEYYRGIEEDLRWLGLDWDEAPLRQTDRIPAYEMALDTLKNLGVLYPCFCTRKEINEMGAPQGPEGPLYPGTCRELAEESRNEKLRAGLSHSWRLDSGKAACLCGRLLTFNDLLHGVTVVNDSLLGDVVLARKDIGVAYHLSVVVDDAFQQITHVTRGEDLLPSTHVHRLLQTLLDLPEPVYLHHPLMVDESGKRLAKRHDSLAIATMREAGISAAEVLAKTQDPSVIRAITSLTTPSSG